MTMQQHQMTNKNAIVVSDDGKVGTSVLTKLLVDRQYQV
jgi:hypothetical protein